MSPPPNQNQPTPATQPPQQNMVQNPQVGTTDSVKKKAVPKVFFFFFEFCSLKPSFSLFHKLN